MSGYEMIIVSEKECNLPDQRRKQRLSNSKDWSAEPTIKEE
jgi:hypothetical protein